MAALDPASTRYGPLSGRTASPTTDTTPTPDAALDLSSATAVRERCDVRTEGRPAGGSNPASRTAPATLDPRGTSTAEVGMGAHLLSRRVTAGGFNPRRGRAAEGRRGRRIHRGPASPAYATSRGRVNLAGRTCFCTLARPPAARMLPCKKVPPRNRRAVGGPAGGRSSLTAWPLMHRPLAGRNATGSARRMVKNAPVAYNHHHRRRLR